MASLTANETLESYVLYKRHTSKLIFRYAEFALQTVNFVNLDVTGTNYYNGKQNTACTSVRIMTVLVYVSC